MKFNIDSVIKNITKPWTPIDLAEFDGKVLRVAKFEGEYHEHTHEYEEFFLIYRGSVTIWTEKGDIDLQEGEGTVIPKGLKHKPIAKTAAYVLMVDSKE